MNIKKCVKIIRKRFVVVRNGAARGCPILISYAHATPFVKAAIRAFENDGKAASAHDRRVILMCLREAASATDPLQFRFRKEHMSDFDVQYFLKTIPALEETRRLFEEDYVRWANTDEKRDAAKVVAREIEDKLIFYVGDFVQGIYYAEAYAEEQQETAA